MRTAVAARDSLRCGKRPKRKHAPHPRKPCAAEGRRALAAKRVTPDGRPRRGAICAASGEAAAWKFTLRGGPNGDDRFSVLRLARF